MRTPSEDTAKIARSAGTVSVAVMCSRLLGLVREQAFAALFGAGYYFDSFVVAFRIPNMLRDLFGEGALSAAFVTVFSDYDSRRGTEETWRLASNVLLFMAMLLSILTLICIAFSDGIVRFLVDAEFEAVPGKVDLTRLLTIIMFPFLILVSLSSVVMGILNTKGRFFVPALSSSFFNVGSIVGGVGLAFLLPRFGQPAIVGMAIGTLIGGALQLLGQLPVLGKVGFVFRPHLNLRDPGLHRVLRLMVPALIGLAPLQINIFVNNYFASSLQEGSLSWLNYAFRLFWFPVGVFGVALSVATLPVIARHAAAKDMRRLRETYTSAITMVFCLAIPATVGLVLLAEPILRVIYQHGRFDAFSTMKTAEALVMYALGLFSYSAVKVIVPVFYALDRTRYPVMGSFLTTAVNVALILATIGQLEHRALALSISCAMTANFLFLSLILYRQLGGYSLSYLLTGLVKVMLASVLMGGLVLGLRNLLAGWMAQGLVPAIGGLLLCVVVGAVLYGVILSFLRLRELDLLTEKVSSRLLRGN